jgi:VPDSG-CTERM motif
MKKLTKYTLSAILGMGISYNANALSFTLNTAFSGDQPDGTVKVDITDFALNTVQLTITSQLADPLAPLENMESLYLNLNPNYDPTSLLFAKTGGTGSFTDPLISTGTNAFKADGDGLYDILFAFAPPGVRFDSTDSITYQVTRAAGLVAADFNELSAPAGGHGPFLAAAHIQNTDGPQGSGWIAPNGAHVPDGGATVMLMGTALACLGALRRRFA